METEHSEISRKVIDGVEHTVTVTYEGSEHAKFHPRFRLEFSDDVALEYLSHADGTTKTTVVMDRSTAITMMRLINTVINNTLI